MKRIRIPPPISGGLLLSYKCSAECRHCMYACSPRWKGDWISQVDLEEGLPKLAGRIKPSPWGESAVSLNYGLHFTSFTGQPCQPRFLRDWPNHFDNYGNLMPGYCGGISLGRWQDLEELEEEGIELEEHSVLRFLIADDMPGLLGFAKDLDYQESGAGYLSKCDLCLDIRKHLVAKGDFRELKPIAFYEHIDRPTGAQHA